MAAQTLWTLRHHGSARGGGRPVVSSHHVVDIDAQLERETIRLDRQVADHTRDRLVHVALPAVAEVGQVDAGLLRADGGPAAGGGAGGAALTFPRIWVCSLVAAEFWAVFSAAI